MCPVPVSSPTHIACCFYTLLNTGERTSISESANHEELVSKCLGNEADPTQNLHLHTHIQPYIHAYILSSTHLQHMKCHMTQAGVGAWIALGSLDSLTSWTLTPE